MLNKDSTISIQGLSLKASGIHLSINLCNSTYGVIPFLNSYRLVPNTEKDKFSNI